MYFVSLETVVLSVFHLCFSLPLYSSLYFANSLIFKMLTCYFFFCSLFFWFFSYHNYGYSLNSDKCYCTELISHSSVSLSLTYFQLSLPIKIINYFFIQSKFIAITALHCFKFHSFIFAIKILHIIY